MCDLYGSAILPELEILRSFARTSRRSVLRASMSSAPTIAIGQGAAALVHAQAGGSLKSTYGNHIASARHAPF
jgi:hypothetical protein